MTAATVTRYTEGREMAQDNNAVDDGMVNKLLAAKGYTLKGIEPVNSEFAATAVLTLANGRELRAQALGRTPIDAARAVVKVVLRD